MINKKQLALSLFIGAGLILIKLVTLAFASPNDMQLQTVSSLFSMGMWYVPLLYVLLYYFVYSSIKCSTANRLLTQCSRLAYGQNGDFGDLPVDAGLRLRAKQWRWPHGH